jgi:lipopolysaccharide/colanic/teichoic acid biosynthesis glycosyltransferase
MYQCPRIERRKTGTCASVRHWLTSGILIEKNVTQLFAGAPWGVLAIKPGITGWAQINGWRGEIDTQEKIKRRVEHDLYYIEWSLLFDLYIVAKTPFALTNTESAY